MTHGWRVVALWGLWLCVLAAIEIIFTPTGIELALLGGAAIGTVLVGLLTLAGEARNAPPRPEGPDPTELPSTSLPSVMLGLGIAVFMLGWEVGTWLMGIGGGIALFAVAALVREKRTARL